MCVLGEVESLWRSWFMHFLSLPNGESCWGQWPVMVLSLTTSLGYFPVHVSLPEHPFCSEQQEEDEEDIWAWSRILKAAWRDTCRGRPSYRRHQTLCPLLLGTLLICLSCRFWFLGQSHSLHPGPSISWQGSTTPIWPPRPLSFHDLTIYFPTGGLRERGKERQDT